MSLILTDRNRALLDAARVRHTNGDVYPRAITKDAKVIPC
jgi:hypothetical protein